MENQELGATLMTSTDLSKEDKKSHIDKFIKDYTDGKVNFFKEEHKNLFKLWVDLYNTTVKEVIKERVKKI